MDALTIALLVGLLGWTGLHGLNVKVEPYVHPPLFAVRTQAPRPPLYACSKDFIKALRAGSKLDPALFCEKRELR